MSTIRRTSKPPFRRDAKPVAKSWNDKSRPRDPDPRGGSIPLRRTQPALLARLVRGASRTCVPTGQRGAATELRCSVTPAREYARRTGAPLFCERETCLSSDWCTLLADISVRQSVRSSQNSHSRAATGPAANRCRFGAFPPGAAKQRAPHQPEAQACRSRAEPPRVAERIAGGDNRGLAIVSRVSRTSCIFV